MFLLQTWLLKLSAPVFAGSVLLVNWTLISPVHMLTWKKCLSNSPVWTSTDPLFLVVFNILLCKPFSMWGLISALFIYLLLGPCYQPKISFIMNYENLFSNTFLLTWLEWSSNARQNGLCDIWETENICII